MGDGLTEKTIKMAFYEGLVSSAVVFGSDT